MGEAVSLLRAEKAARQLLDAMERQHGSALFSQNVVNAKAELRALFPKDLDPADYAKGKR